MSLTGPAADDALGRDELEAGLAARRELGPAYDAALVDGFADRIEQVVTARVADRAGAGKALAREQAARGQRQMVLGIVSLGTGIPITAIAGGIADLPGIVAAWVGIVGVNAAHAITGRQR